MTKTEELNKATFESMRKSMCPGCERDECWIDYKVASVPVLHCFQHGFIPLITIPFP